MWEPSDITFQILIQILDESDESESSLYHIRMISNTSAWICMIWVWALLLFSQMSTAMHISMCGFNLSWGNGGAIVPLLVVCLVGFIFWYHQCKNYYNDFVKTNLLFWSSERFFLFLNGLTDFKEDTATQNPSPFCQWIGSLPFHRSTMRMQSWLCYKSAKKFLKQSF